jgi:hypothetical protein
MIGLATTQQTDGRHTRLLTEDPTISLQVRRGLVVELAGKQSIPSQERSSHACHFGYFIGNYARESCILPRHAPDRCREIQCSSDGTTRVRAGDDEIDVPREGMESATFHTDKVELAKMAGTL